MKKSKNITLAEVAKEAGVSVATVSYVINNDQRIKASTTQKVKDAVKKLGYVPQGMARDMRNSKTEIIGLFVRDIHGPYYAMIMQEINAVAQDYGYELIISVSGGKNSKNSYRFLRERRIDGAIILENLIEDELLLHVSHSNFPVIVLDRKLHSKYIRSIIVDGFSGEYKACEHLINIGRKRIAYITGVAASFDSNERLRGYLQCLKDNDIEMVPKHIVCGDFVEDGGYLAMKKILASGEYVDGLLAANDQMAIGAMRAIQEAGMTVPDDIAVVGFDNIQSSSLMRPSLTTMNYDIKEWGNIAMKYLLYAMEHGGFKDEHKDRIISPYLIKRDSTLV